MVPSFLLFFYVYVPLKKHSRGTDWTTAHSPEPVWKGGSGLFLLPRIFWTGIRPKEVENEVFRSAEEMAAHSLSHFF
jgi:hypothetical protein